MRLVRFRRPFDATFERNTMNRLERMRARMEQDGWKDFYVRDISSVKWLTGFEGVFDSEAAHLAFVTPNSAILHTDSRYSDAAVAAAEGTDWTVDDTRATHAKWVADAFAAHHEQAGTQPGRGICGFAIEDSLSIKEYRALESAFAEKAWSPRLVETDQVVVKLRACKDEAEIERLRAAQAITDAAFEHIIGFMREGMTEREVQFELEQTMRKMGAEDLAFSSIIASGANGASPHSIPGDKRLEAGDLVVMDFGAKAKGYCSDMTRTVAIGYVSDEAKAVVDAVREANETVEAMLKPGVTGKAAHELAEYVLAQHGFAGKMGHGLGHGVGIDIHELPVLSPRNEAPLEVGNVVTVEPGVYLSGKMGCRLEDFGIITPDGFEVFTQSTHELVII